MLKLTGTELRNLNAGNQREHNVGRKPMFQVGLDAKGIRSIDQNACMLRGDDRLDDSGKIVNIGQGFHTQDHIIIGVFPGRRVFRVADDCGGITRSAFRVGYQTHSDAEGGETVP